MCDKTETSCAGIQDGEPNDNSTPVAATASEGDSRSEGSSSGTDCDRILDPFRNLAKRWRDSELQHKDIFYRVTHEERKQNRGFYQTTWTRYVDYGRRAAELELRIRLTEKVFGNGR
jgi:hypothetical protein